MIADTIFGEPRSESALQSGHSIAQDGEVNAKDVAGIPWFDLFSMDELLADFAGTESGDAFQQSGVVTV